ncbi:hypothetical protein [Yinghuangia soli]|uniref:Uncharacterized protein n=1 Tax=Yinghuangia soli TaxID=2908204 RepID=A0AA41PXF8_9ACTN|nr:hypothetical protein [Yinghuangia soli]MCF2527347.1 hypothetical protein [Yinghuangia soli]
MGEGTEDQTPVPEPKAPTWTRRWLLSVAVIAALGAALPRLIGDGEESRPPLSVGDSATQAQWTPNTPAPMPTLPPVPHAPRNVQGCPEWIDTWDIGPELTPAQAAPPAVVAGRPDSAVVCRYLVPPFTVSRQAHLTGARALPDTAAYVSALAHGDPVPTGLMACVTESPYYEYLIVFTGSEPRRQVVHLSGACHTARNKDLTVKIDVRHIAALATLYATP